MLRPLKIVVTGGPATGKTAVINALKARNYMCFEEVSRQIILQGRESGVNQPFLTEPLMFSEKILNGRIKHFNIADKLKLASSKFIFLDRGIPDVLAYMHFKDELYPKWFTSACRKFRYDIIFILPPWKAIYKDDNERYETFNEAQLIHTHLVETYKQFNYNLIEVPTGLIDTRVNFILKKLETLL